jgi:hypothetical protein
MLKKIQKLFQKKQQNNTNLLFNKCNELPIHNFNEIANNNDFSYLKRDCNSVVSDDLIQSTWLNILDEFLSISNNTYAVNMLKKRSKILLLERRLKVLEALNYCISKGIDVSIEMKEYRMTNNRLNSNISLIKNDISRLTNTIPTEEKTNNNSSDFERTIAIIIKNGYQIDRFKTVVSEFCSILNLIEQQHKAQKQQ